MDDMLEVRRRILQNTPHLASISGSGIVSLNTDMGGVLGKCIVNFSPVQASGAPAPDNELPITGWEKIEFSHSGENMFDVVNAQIIRGQSSYYYPDYGSYITSISKTSTGFTATVTATSAGVVICVGYVEKGVTYTVDWKRKGSTGRIYLETYSIGSLLSSVPQSSVKLQTFVNGLTVDGPKTFTPTTSGWVWIGIIAQRAGEIGIESISLTTGESAITPYKNPSGQRINVDWTSEIGTVHGGYLDLLTGGIYKTFQSVDMGDLNWEIANGRFYASIQNIKIGADNNYLSPALCDIYPTITYNNIIRQAMTGVAVNNTAFIRAYDPNYPTANGFKTAVDGHTLVYPLSEPVLMGTLSPVSIKALKGQNNIWSTANGNIELSYWTH